MNASWKKLATKNPEQIKFNFGSFFARSCFVAVLMGNTVLFADPVAARKAANPSDLKVFFPQRHRALHHLTMLTKPS